MSEKPKKPRNFPLYPHANGQWAKKIRGKTHFFGVWSNPQTALANYHAQVEDLQAGRRPRRPSDGISVADLADCFMEAKSNAVDAGELSKWTLKGYLYAAEWMVKHFGPDTPAETLTPTDFAEFKVSLGKTLSPVSIADVVRVTRIVFKWGYEAEHLDRPARFGPDFKLPSKSALRREKNAKPKREFSAYEIRTLLRPAAPQVRAMILLGINCGFGNHDCGELCFRHIDRAQLWIDFPRPKTGIDRRCKLWPETLRAIDASTPHRKKPRDKADSDRVFLTRYGRPWASPDGSDGPLSKEMAKLLKRLGFSRRGVGFYALRHTFETVAGETADQVAVDAVMGHADQSMAAHYREGISDERLDRVSSYVRGWLFPESVRKPEA